MSSTSHGLPSIFAKLLARFAGKKPRKPRKTALAVEGLEERCVPATFTPTTTVDSNNPGSLRYDINQANTNAATSNTIMLKAGTYNLTLGELQLDKSAGSYIIDGAGAGKTIIQAKDAARVFEVDNCTVTFENLTIKGGMASDGGSLGGSDALGGGILSVSSYLTLNDVVVSGNTAQGTNGGTVATSSGGTSFNANGANAQGGGLYVFSGGLLIEGGTKISNNLAQGGYGAQGTEGSSGSARAGGSGGNAQGGGLYVKLATVTVSNSTVSGNTAMGGAGGNGANNTGISEDNFGGDGGDGGDGEGGGFFTDAANMTIQNSTISGNLAEAGAGGAGGTGDPFFGGPGGNGGNGGDGLGGGVFVGSTTVTFSNCTIAENLARGGNGGAGGNGTNSTTSEGVGGPGGGGGNAGANQGGGLYVDSGILNLGNATVAFNTAGSSAAGAGGQAGTGGPYGSNGVPGSAGTSPGSQGGGVSQDSESGTANVVSTLIADNAVDNGAGSMDPDVFGFFSDANGGFNFIGTKGDATGFTSATDLTGNPIISALGNYGGPTQTIALLNGSPAIDKGSNPDGLSYDQRGKGFLRVIGAAADIGAYEVQNNMCVCLCMNMDTMTSGSGSPTKTPTYKLGGSPHI